MPWPSSARARPAAAEQALAQLDCAGTLVFVGTGAEPVPVNHNRMIVLELEALGAFNYSAEGFQPALDLLESGAMPIDLLIEAGGRGPGRGDGGHGPAVPRGDPGQGAGEPGGAMTIDQTRPVRPVINHVAISVDAGVLDDAGRAALLDFFGEVFGWVEGDNSTEKGNPLILYTGEMRQYLYLLPAADEYLRAPHLDHFGLEIASRDELVAILDRAKAYREKDDRVDHHRPRRDGDPRLDVGLHPDQRLHRLPDPAA